MRRRLLLIVPFTCILFLLAAGGIQALWAAYQIRPVTGRLTTSLPGTSVNSGPFHFTWDGERQRLAISHESAPEKTIWASHAGQPFVAAAYGVETVVETRGSFQVEDLREVVCSQQDLAAIEAVGAAVQVSGTLACSDNRAPVAYTLTFTPAGSDQLVFQLETAAGDLNRTYLTYETNDTERFFGFGEQFSYFDMKGRRLPIFVMEQGVGRGAQPITAGANLQAGAGGDWHTSYAGVPHYITSQLRSLYLETSEYAVFDMRRSDQVQIQLFSGRMTGRILTGESPAALIASYTANSGRMRRLPDWILGGAVVGMQGGTERVREVYAQLQAHDVPVAAFWLQDWVGQRPTSFGQQLWWNWELDEARYPGWSDLVADLAADDVAVMTYASPFLADVADKDNVNRNLFQEARGQGYLVQNQAGTPYLILNTDFSAGLVDLTNPAAWAWYRGVLATEVVGAGASGWMADFGEALPYDAVLFSGAPAASVHNQYPELWAQLNREVVDGSDRPDELVFFNRAGYRESPRYATLFWLGDQLVSWDRHDGIKTAVTGLLSSGLSGYAYNHSDIGGYTTISNPLRDYHRGQELLLRWMDLNAFTTIFRTHEGNLPAANVQFYEDETTLAHFSRMARVYAAWEFYRRDLVDAAAATGLPVVRHLFIHYPDDSRVYDISYQEFMVGSELLVAPVLDPGLDTVEVYLPAGAWVHLWSGQTYGAAERGTTVVVSAPLGQPAVFYPAGSAVGEQFAANLAAAGLMP